MLTGQLHSAVALALALCAPGWIHASENNKKEDDKKEKDAPGLEVGAKAPGFKLKDQNEKNVALEDLLKKGPVAVVFHRSASW